MLNRLRLRCVGPSPELELGFAPRLNLFTGDNGLGKSFVLDVAWWALTRSWAGAPAWPDPAQDHAPEISYRVTNKAGGQDSFRSRFQFETQAWTEPKGRPPKWSLVIYARVDGSFSLWDPARNAWGSTVSEEARIADRPAAYHFSPETLWNGLIEDNRVLCEGLIRDWVSWQRQSTSAFDRLSNVLRVLSPGEQEVLRPGPPTRVSLDDVRDMPTLQMPYGRVPLIHASAGMKRVISLAYLLVWAWEEHLRAADLLRRVEADRIVFLFDEAEAHLHPAWQRLIVPGLLEVVTRLRDDVKVQVLATTHAPLVLASLEPLFDTRQDALFTFDLKGAHIEVAKADWQRRGDASSWLTSEAFDLGEARSLPAETAIHHAMEAMRQPELPIERAKQIHHELHDLLKDTDPFWPRWLVKARAAGIEP